MGVALLQKRRRAQKYRTQSLNLRCSASWHESNDARLFVNFQHSAGALPIRFQGNNARQGVADIGDGYTGVSINWLFEREDHQHVRNGLSYRMNTLAAPRPDRGAYELHRGYATFAQTRREPQIEIWRIDTHKNRWRLLNPASLHTATHGQQRWQTP